MGHQYKNGCQFIELCLGYVVVVSKEWYEKVGVEMSDDGG